MKVDELAKAWNDLANAALGRGTTPNVPPKLAGEVRREYDAWRAALADEHPFADVFASISTREWVRRYRALRAKVVAAKAGPSGKRAKPGVNLEKTPLETTLDALDRTGRMIAYGLVAAGATGVLIAIIRSASNRG